MAKTNLSIGAAQLVTVATAWGTAHGGVNAFNYDFTIGLAKELRQPVACVVPLASAQQTKEALEVGVLLFPIASMFEESSVAPVKLLEDFSQVEFWVGHDIITGDVACALRDKTEKGEVITIMHQSYHDYAAVKHPGGATTDKSRRQKQLFSRTQHRFAVGPLLQARLTDLISEPAHVLVPGLRDLKLARSRSSLDALIFGRLTQDNALMKGTSLACNAVGEAVRLMAQLGIQHPMLSSPGLKLIGVETDDTHAITIKDEVEKRANRCVNFHIFGFLNQQALLDEMDGSNLCLMLSWHEGFGLSGWEAIGAGIPLILSMNSGLYKFLEQLGGHATGCVLGLNILGSSDRNAPYRDEDLQTAAQAVIKIAQDIGRAIENAQYLKRLLIDEGYTWEKTARSIVEKSGGDHLLRPRPLPSSVTSVASPYAGFSEGFDNARLRERHNIALVLYQTCYYQRALNEIQGALSAPKSVSHSLKLECALLEARILLRLNQHKAARKTAQRVEQYYREKDDWQKTIRARGIINTVERDLCNYDLAVTLARETVDLARTHCISDLGNTMRDLARSLALAGTNDGEAEGVAQDAVGLAGNGLERAKAFLALGEAHRHGLNQPLAIEAYVQSIRWATTIGHYDCLLWSSLGLSDSLFLEDSLKEASTTLSTLRQIVEDPDRRFPLETLHYNLSLLSLEIRQNRQKGNRAKARAIVNEYSKLGVKWPKQYMMQVQSDHFVAPKKL